MGKAPEKELRRRAVPLLTGIVVLTALVLFALSPVLDNGFTNYDDDTYVTRNPHVQEGLSPESIVWAFTTFHAANWHPLTWISHMVDWTLYGPDPTGHHRTSLLIHLVNALLLWRLLAYMTAAEGRSLVVAAFFAVHPLHVESVAWIAERKDVLSTLFWLLATWAYVRYARHPSGRGMLLVAVLFLAALMAKPMPVTLPFSLLLLDAWPFGRFPLDGAGPKPGTSRHLIREKLPLLVLSAASCGVTVWAQRAGEAMGSMEHYPIAVRVRGALDSYVAYLGKTFWPRDLAVFYPHRGSSLPTWEVTGSALLLLAITAGAYRARRRAPYLLVSWLGYLGTLVPVIGFVQVGDQAMADRYMYVPLVGIFVALTWGAHDLPRAFRTVHRGAERSLRWLSIGAAALLVLLLAVTARSQARVWRDSVTLFAHALRVTGGNVTVHVNLGAGLEGQGKIAEAAEHYRKALAIAPLDREANNRLGSVLSRKGDLEGAVNRYQAALRGSPEDPETLNNLGVALARQGKLPDAIEQFDAALRSDPEGAEPHANLANALALTGRLEEAVVHYEEAIAREPGDADILGSLASVLLKLGRTNDAAARLSEVVRIRPGDARARYRLAIALHRLGRVDEARAELEASRRLGLEPSAASETPSTSSGVGVYPTPDQR